MRSKIAIITIILSVFILGALVAGYVRTRKNTEVSNKTATAEAKDEPAAFAKPPVDEPSDTTADDIPSDGEYAEVAENTPVPTETPSPEQVREPLPIYKDILPINPYVAGWLEIDGTKIDDPVVYTPGSQNYFLHRDIDGSDTSKGTLFIAVNWREGFNNTLIYGHNMKDGTVFGSLAKFAQKDYGLKHSLIRFDTLYEERDYKLLGVFYSQIDEDELETEEDRAEKDKAIAEAAIAKKEEEAAAESEAEAETEPEPSPHAEDKADEPEKPSEPEVPEEPPVLTLNDIDLHRDFGDEDIYRYEKDMDNGRFRYYYYTDLADRDDFEYYVRNVKEKSLYDTGCDAEWGDELITLSTCSYHVPNGRFVVVGVRKKND